MGITPNAEGSAFVWFGKIYSLGLAVHFGFSWSLLGFVFSSVCISCKFLTSFKLCLLRNNVRDV